MLPITLVAAIREQSEPARCLPVPVVFLYGLHPSLKPSAQENHFQEALFPSSYRLEINVSSHDHVQITKSAQSTAERSTRP